MIVNAQICGASCKAAYYRFYRHDIVPHCRSPGTQIAHASLSHRVQLLQKDLAARKQDTELSPQAAVRARHEVDEVEVRAGNAWPSQDEESK